jgi:hypothetical protein
MQEELKGLKMDELFMRMGANAKVAKVLGSMSASVKSKGRRMKQC